jgi:hypothetical protein
MVRGLSLVRSHVAAGAADGRLPRLGTLHSRTGESVRLLRGLCRAGTVALTYSTQVRDRAPKVWEMMKPARDALIGEAVKKLLGL